MKTRFNNLAIFSFHKKQAYTLSHLWELQTSLIMMKQRNGARLGDYRQRSSVTGFLLHLKWDLLESRRQLFNLKYVRKIFSNQVALKPLDYFSVAAYRTRNFHSLVILSLFISIIPTWNSLSDNIVSQCN